MEDRMKHLLFPVLFAGIVFFSVGLLVGYFAGNDAGTWNVSGYQAKEGGPGSGFTVPVDRTSLIREASIEQQKHRLDPEDRAEETKPFPENQPPYDKHNPYTNKSNDTLVSVLNRTGNEQDRDHAMQALLQRLQRDPLSVASQLGRITRHGVMHTMCRELVQNGGREGLDAVLSFVSQKTADIEMRCEAIHALGVLPPESAALGREALLSLMNQPLPHELQHSVCNAYCRNAKGAGVDHLIGMLTDDACMIRPEVILGTIGREGTPQDAGKLLTLLENGTWTHGVETAILRSAARAGKKGDFLLDLFQSPEGGVSKRSIANAFADAASYITFDTGRVVSLLSDQTLEPDIRSELSRALVRSGGDDGVNLLLELADSERAGIDADVLGAAFAEVGRVEDLPLMTELLSKVKGSDVMHQLSRKIIETGGREGVEALLKQIEEQDLHGEVLHPLCGAIAEAGTEVDAPRLFDLVQHETDPEAARVLLKTACRLSGEDGLKRAMDLLQNAEDGNVRAAAAGILAHEAAGLEETIPYLAGTLEKETFGRAQWEIAHALAESGAEGINELGRLMKQDPNEQRRHEMLNSVEPVRTDEIMPFLAQTLATDRAPGIRIRAAEILGDRGTEEAVKALVHAKGTEADPDVLETINRQLERLQNR